MVISNDLKPGMSFKYDGAIYTVLDVWQNKTAMRKMVVKVKAKNIRTGAITDISMTGGDKIENIRLDKATVQYLYDEGDALVFMNTETYDQISIEKARLEWEMNFLKENTEVEVSSFEGEVLGINLPSKVVLKIVETEPAVKGDTAKTATKDAKLETGFMIRVPLFIENDEDVIVRTDTGEYDSRA